ncbi:hypothetical protein VNO77_37185 [Canavalia gladiata]|uniref:Uncharacterized protein n=1 Tax=Canavalia gladiata TaxID=3824 RepID=A0AAN9K8P0_CANGL
MYMTYLFASLSIVVCTLETCRKVLIDYDQLKLGYPASAMTFAGKRSFHGISNVEHKHLRHLITSSITGRHALSMYIGLIEGIAVKMLEDLCSMNTPCEFLTKLRKCAFKIITTIFIGSHTDHVEFGLLENLYTNLNRGMKSLDINLLGFAFHKALNVIII